MVFEKSDRVERLMELDPEFRMWVEQHRELDRETEALSHQHCLIPAEEQRIRVLKKQKLVLLDQIQIRLREYQNSEKKS